MKSRKLTTTAYWQKRGWQSHREQDWGVIETIKELKEGYLSQVIHKLTDLMIANNAIIVMEDFEFRFQAWKAESGKQVIRSFEKMLIDSSITS